MTGISERFTDLLGRKRHALAHFHGGGVMADSKRDQIHGYNKWLQGVPSAIRPPIWRRCAPGAHHNENRRKTLPILTS
jgi:hypothetical protein